MGHVRHILAGRRNRLLQMGQSHSDRVVPLKGHTPCDHLIHGDAKGIDVAALIAVAAPGLFR